MYTPLKFQTMVPCPVLSNTTSLYVYVGILRQIHTVKSLLAEKFKLWKLLNKSEQSQNLELDGSDVR